MPEPDLASFDPYDQWLGIPPAEQPPDHYRLLGLARFETDPARIAAAADARLALLRSVQTGPRGLVAQKIMNEVAAARVCLLSPERKSVYDKELWQRLATQARAAVPQPPGHAAPGPSFGSLPQSAQPLAGTHPAPQVASPGLLQSGHRPLGGMAGSATPQMGIFPQAAAIPGTPTDVPASPSVSVVRYRRRRQRGLWIWVIATVLAIGGLVALAHLLSQKLP